MFFSSHISNKNQHSAFLFKNTWETKEVKGKTQRDICVSVFVEALFTIAKAGRKPIVQKWIVNKKCGLCVQRYIIQS